MPAGTIAEWLTEIGLPEYIEVFEREGIGFRVLPELTNADLVELGLTLGPRKLLTKAIADLPTFRAPGRHAAGGQGPAERRQLTVLFCDLVGSTQLSRKLDPEALREVMASYQRACTIVVDKYDGHVAQYLGDGIMAYFGWPKAHEDDAERSVRAGLEIREIVKTVAVGDPLQIRIGIATGPVVIGETGGGDASVPKAAVGETPNIAARLQAIAAPGEIVVSAITRRLLARLFHCRDLGDQTLKGVVEPVRAFAVEGVSQAESRFEARRGEDLTPFVGREDEVSLLLRRWGSACRGEGHVILLGGEAGIGKSRIVRELREMLAVSEQGSLRCQCSPYYSNTVLHPFVAALERAAQLQAEDPVEVRLEKLDRLLEDLGIEVRSGSPLLAAMLSVSAADRYPPIRVSPQRQKEQTLELLTEIVLRLARRTPLLFVFEDVHWIDPSSLEVLDLLVSRIAQYPVLLVVTFRPEFRPRWLGQSQVTLLSLNRLAHRQAVAMVARVTEGHELPEAVLNEIIAKTDGVPLFVEELTKAVLESGLMQLQDGRYELNAPLASLAIPSTLHDSLMARLDRVAEVREVAQIGACVGREFSYELLAAVSDLPEHALHAALDQLVASELVFRRGELPEALITFKHALVQDAAYESLLKSRRQVLHARIATALTARFKERTANEPEVAAHHYSAAGMNAEAVAYWLIAGQRAIERFANAEAENHLRRGLGLLQSLPSGPARDKQELLLQMALGSALGSKGYTSAEVGSTFARARELCQHVGDMPQMFPILFGLWIYYIMRAEFQASHDVGAQILDLGKHTSDAIGVLVGSYSLGGTHLFRGELAKAAECSETSLANYQRTWDKTLTATFGHSAGPAAADWASVALWFLGYPDKARERGELAVQLARELDHPLTLATVLVHRAFLEAMRGDVQETLKYAQQTVALARDTGILIRQVEGELLQGWAIARMGDADQGIRQLEASLAIWNQAGAYIADPTWLGLLADAHASVGRHAKAHEVLASALAIVQKNGERLWESGLLCLEGRCHLDGEGDEQSAERCFRAAIGVAQRQDAKMLELEASVRLAHLWKSQDKHKEACDVLRPVCDWFTEGSDTKALKEAKGLLEELMQH